MSSEEKVRYWVRDELRKILDKGLMYSLEVAPKPQPKEYAKPETRKLTATEIAEKFPEDLRQHLTIDATKGTIKTKFVSHEKWVQMDAIARELGYEYVSAGKDSHWERKK